MQKNNILSLFFLLAFVTFVKSQDFAHTPLSTDRSAHLAFDSRPMEINIAENPSLKYHWNRLDLLSNIQLISCDNFASVVAFAKSSIEVIRFELFVQKTGMEFKQKGEFRYVDNDDSFGIPG